MHHSRFIWSIIVAMIVGLSVHTSYGQTPNKRGVKDVTSPASSTLAPGKNFALVIGNNNYRYVEKLKTAVNDANAVDQLLRAKYGFTTNVLRDATRSEILTTLNNYRRTLPPDSNLLIYYAGHGYHDQDTDKAYWLPVDAQKDNNENWISADDISSDVKAIPSNHILIISDSCYSGVLTRNARVEIKPQYRAAYLAKVERSKSRTLISSGGDEPVADSGAPDHSIFASAILDSLDHMELDRFTAADLFNILQPSVAGRSEQLPQYSVIRNSGHEYGDFIFTRRSGSPGVSTASEPAANTAPPESTAPPAGSGRESKSGHSSTAAPGSPAQKQSFGQGYQSGAGVPSSGASPSLPQSQPKTSPGNIDVRVQQYAVVHYGADTTQFCFGFLTIQPGVIQYRAIQGAPTVQGYHGGHSFDFPLASVKEVKKNAIFGVNYQAFHIRLSGNDNYNFSIIDMTNVNNPRFLNADSFLMAVNAALGK